MEAIVEYNYEAREADELSLRKGDIIKNIKVLEGGWWEGTLKDKRGMFPDNFIKVLDSSSGSASGTDMSNVAEKNEETVVLRNGGSGRKWCKVLFSYEPVKSDELQLLPQDMIEYLGEVEEGWSRGRLRGQVGVFPSNFVTPPMPEKKQLYKVLFPYKAVNEDELTLVEGDIITLLSKDAPDKGWWKGEVNGQIGLFPDNFVELISSKSERETELELEQKHDTSQVNPTSSIKSTHNNKHNEKAHARKSLDTKNTRTGASTYEKKSPSLISSLKRIVGDGSSNSGNGNASAALGEELDEVERGEGMPLSHLTASRAKAPRRRPPSTQHLRHHTNANTPTTHTNTTTTSTTSTDENITNGNIDNNLKVREDEGDGVVTSKVRRKAPWVEELKLNQLERKKVVDKGEKLETQKERTNPRLTIQNITESETKPDVDNEELKAKEEDKPKRVTSLVHAQPSPNESSPSPPGYVPYHIFNQLLERVCLLEENQLVLQRTVNQLAQMVPNSPNSIPNKE